MWWNVSQIMCPSCPRAGSSKPAPPKKSSTTPSILTRCNSWRPDREKFCWPKHHTARQTRHEGPAGRVLLDLWLGLLCVLFLQGSHIGQLCMGRSEEHTSELQSRGPLVCR